MEALSPDSFGQVADEITLRPHLRSGPVGEIAVIHGKAVVMLKDRNYIFSTGVLEELRPRLGIVVLGLEHRDEVLIAELRQRAIFFNVVLIDSRARKVHLAWIPLVAESRNGVKAPVDENAEFRIFVPVWNLVARESIPIGTERTVLRIPVDLLQDYGSSPVILGTGLDPLRG